MSSGAPAPKCPPAHAADQAGVAAGPPRVPGGRQVGGLLLGAAVLLVAMNLRPSVASLGPLLDEARSALGASATWAGLLTTVPVLCFAAAGLLAPAVARRAGLRATIAVALAMVATGLVLRVTAGTVLMTVATVIASVGVAAAGVLLPVVVKTSFPARVGLLTGLYTAALQTGAALAFALSAPLARLLGGWRPALASWAVLAVLTLGVWLIAARGQSARRGPPRGERVAGRSLLGNGFAWIITGFFGLQAFVAFAVIGWLAQVLMDAGISRDHAGVLLSLLTIIALPISLLVPPLAASRPSQSGWIVGLGLCGFAGTAGFLIAPSAAPLLWALLLGLGMSVFSLALTVIALRARTGEDTARLSGMAQGFGYLLAAAGPLVFGLLHDVTGGWTAPLAVLLGVIVAQTVTGAVAGRPRHI